MIREPYNLNPYNSTIDTSKVNNFSFTFSGDELGSWDIEIAKNNTSPEIVYTSEEFVPEDVGYTHIYDGDIVEGITLPSTIAHSQGDDGLLRRLYSINGYPFNTAVVKLNVNEIENIGNIKGSTANGYLVATNYSLGRAGDNVTIAGFDKDGTAIGSQITDGTYDFLGYLLSVKKNSNIEVGQVVQIEDNSFIIGNIEDAGDGYSELTIVNGETSISDATPMLTFDSLAEADVTELTVGIEPVQDLNGYDKPWVGGAGKNILDVADRTISDWEQTPETIRTEGCTVTKSGDTLTCTITGAWSKLRLAIDTSTLVNGQAYTVSAKFSNPSANVVGVAWYDTTWHNTTTSRDTTATVSTSFTYSSDMSTVALGFIVNNTNASTGNTVVVSEMQLEKGSSKTSFAPYSNICPITGHDEVTVTRTGKNLLPNIRTGSLTRNGITYTVNDDKSITVKGTATSLSYFEINTTNLNTYSETLFKAGVPIYTNVEGGLPIRYTDGTYDLIQSGVSTTPPKDIGVAYLQVNNGVTIDKTIYPMVCLASVADDTYEPYQGSTYTTSLGQTVYGGTLDMVTGVLTVTHLCKTLTTADLNISYVSGASDADSNYYNITNAFSSGETVNDASGRSSLFKWYTNLYSNRSVEGVTGQGAYVSVRINSSRVADTSSDALKAYLPTTWQVYAKLATPQTYQLTPQQIKTLVGTNNVWASSGDIVSIKFAYETN